MPDSPGPIRHRHVQIVLIVLLPPCVHTFHRHHPLQHTAHPPVAVDDLADTVDPADRVVGHGVAEVDSIIGVA